MADELQKTHWLAMKPPDHDLTRREFVGVTVGAATLGAPSRKQRPPGTPEGVACSLTINGQRHELHLEPRVTLLDLLRERLHLTGSKKGCDHGQCGACTVLVDGARILSCLTLAVTQQGKRITTIEAWPPAKSFIRCRPHSSNTMAFNADFAPPDRFVRPWRCWRRRGPACRAQRPWKAAIGWRLRRRAPLER